MVKYTFLFVCLFVSLYMLCCTCTTDDDDDDDDDATAAADTCYSL